MNPADQVRFLVDIQSILKGGQFTSTYKYALLMAIADICVEKKYGNDPKPEIPIDDLAEKFIQYYWRHAIPYAGRDGATLILVQNAGNQAEVISIISMIQHNHGTSFALVRRNQLAWRSLLRDVSRVIVKMPLWKLQTVSRETREFIYRHENATSKHIVLEPGVADHFRLFYDLIRNLAQVAWMNRIRSLEANRAVIGENTDLSEFLFGSERQDLGRYRQILMELQKGCCFYCGSALRDDSSAVDHFIPWSRYPIDLGHNFVLADTRCNSAKTDLLAAEQHLGHWLERNDAHGHALGREFDSIGAAHDLGSSLNVASWAYEQNERVGAEVWISGRKKTPLTPQWRNCFLPRAYDQGADPDLDFDLAADDRDDGSDPPSQG